jgi:hypothetical protein
MSGNKHTRRPKFGSSWKARAAAAGFVADLVLSLVSPAFAASAGINFSGQVSTGASAVLYPLAATTVSFADSAALKLRSANTSHDTVRLELKAYDANSNPVALEVWTGQDMLQPGEATLSTVVLPLGAASATRFTVCAIETSMSGSVVGRVCGNYLVKHQSLN